MIRFIEKVGFFRLTLIPMGIAIIWSAIASGLIGMGLIGLVVLVFGIFNKCLLLGKCDVPEERSSGRATSVSKK